MNKNETEDVFFRETFAKDVEKILNEELDKRNLTMTIEAKNILIQECLKKYFKQYIPLHK